MSLVRCAPFLGRITSFHIRNPDQRLLCRLRKNESMTDLRNHCQRSELGVHTKYSWELLRVTVRVNTEAT
jgi:hypothetical protein